MIARVKAACAKVDIATAAAVALFVVVGLGLAVYAWQELQGPFEPLHGYTAPVIENKDTINEDGYLRMRMVRCNSLERPLIVEVVVAFAHPGRATVDIPDQPLTLATPSTNIVFTLPPGCTDTIVRYHLPSELTEADWRLIGLDKALGPGTDRQFWSWQSAEFTID